MTSKVYLGDSVYAEWHFMGLRLTTENGYPDDPRNEIFLEPEVLENLMEYLKESRLKKVNHDE